MRPIVDPVVINRLIDEMREKYERLTELQRSHEDMLRACTRHRERLNGQIGHLRAILQSLDYVRASDELLGVPASAQATEGEETMYLGATPEESLRGRDDNENIR